MSALVGFAAMAWMAPETWLLGGTVNCALIVGAGPRLIQGPPTTAAGTSGATGSKSPPAFFIASSTAGSGRTNTGGNISGGGTGGPETSPVTARGARAKASHVAKILTQRVARRF